MTVREQLVQRESEWLAPWAAHSRDAIRALPITPDDLRTEYQRDRDRILHSKSFRRLKDKTQCFLAPEGDHYRTRLTHTLEVSQIARTLARSLRLNEDLAEAVALGHDLGHTPFGHMGERILDRLIPGGFQHREQSLRVVTLLENEGEGLNLSEAVRDGILHHSGSTPPATLEGQCVARADRIAYINHDIDDALRAGVLSEEDIPKELTRVLGKSHGVRINTMVQDVVAHSVDGTGIRMSDEIGAATLKLRTFLMDNVYMRPEVRREEEKTGLLLEALLRHTLEHPENMPQEYQQRAASIGLHRTVCDFLAGMTDHYAILYFERIHLPAAFTR